MKFYNIADEYINFLRTFDSKVSENKQESRPYIGVVIEIEEMKYRAIRADSEEIIKTAARLRKLVMTGDENLTTFDKRIKERCCNLKIIEQVYTQFNMKQTNR